MAEPLKNAFTENVPVQIARWIESAYPQFDHSAFLECSLNGFLDLELTPRAWQIADCLAVALPEDRASAVNIISESLGPENPDVELTGMESFVYLPLVFFVGRYGLTAYQESMHAQYELTKRFTAEFSIRAFLQEHPKRTLARLSEWAHDPNVHVRRLVSEGSRPRLPWAARLPQFQKDPTPVLALLEILKDDPEEYVRRSVANNLNDIAKDNPQATLETAARWWGPGDANRRKLIRHALRTLVKQGDPQALKILGFDPDGPARIAETTIEPTSAHIGEKIRISTTVLNPAETATRALVDFEIDFVKASGRTSATVFKGGSVELAPGEGRVISKLVSVAQHSTRKHYPGQHTVSVLLNGVRHELGSFELLAPKEPGTD